MTRLERETIINFIRNPEYFNMNNKYWDFYESVKSLYQSYLRKENIINTFKIENNKLIARIKELEEINKEHQKQNGELQTKLSELEENQIWSEATIEGLKRDFISKSKVKEKIEELEKEIEEKQENGTDFTIIHEHEIDTNGIIQVLQEFLEQNENHIPRID